MGTLASPRGGEGQSGFLMYLLSFALGRTQRKTLCAYIGVLALQTFDKKGGAMVSIIVQYTIQEPACFPSGFKSPTSITIPKGLLFLCVYAIIALMQLV